MAQRLVRNVDDDVVAWLKARAAANGRSVEAEHREVLRAARMRARLAGRRITPSEILLRQSRDER